jgi:hypothetical protein
MNSLYRNFQERTTKMITPISREDSISPRWQPHSWLENFWPWRTISRLRDLLNQRDSQLSTIDFAAKGAFGQFPKDGEMFTDPRVWTSGLAEVMKLINRLDKYTG